MLRKNVAGQEVHFSLFKSGARIANPTIAETDFKVDIDGGGQANVATPPTSDGAGLVKWLPSQAETNGTYITLLANDAAGDEWEPATFEFDTRLADIIAAELATYDAPTKTELDSGLAALPAAVWTYATRTLSSISALLSIITAGVWAYASRTLTQSAASVVAAVSGDSIAALRGDYWSIALTDIGDISSRTKLYFTVKEKYSDPDAQALIQIEETDGLLYSNGAVATTPANGSITVSDEATGDLTIVIKAAETQNYAPGSYRYDIQYIAANGPTTPVASGTFTITADITRRVA
jgi:hypothetical protein